MKNYITRIALTVLTLIYSSISVFAAPEDHGRWYSLDDDGGSTSPVLMVIGGIVGIICAVLLIISVFNDDAHTSSDRGCIVTFLGICIAIGVLALMKMCGG